MILTAALRIGLCLHGILDTYPFLDLLSFVMDYDRLTVSLSALYFWIKTWAAYDQTAWEQMQKFVQHPLQHALQVSLICFYWPITYTCSQAALQGLDRACEATSPASQKRRLLRRLTELVKLLLDLYFLEKCRSANSSQGMSRLFVFFLISDAVLYKQTY